MASTIENPSAGRARPGIRLAIALLGLALAAVFWLRTASTPTLAALPEVDRSKLVLKESWLEWNGHPFTGWMLEQYPDGLLKSRSAISNGVLHGLSQGWFTNQILQVSEHFTNGVSHGERRRWDEQGRRVSRAQIEGGKIAGLFRRWHENGIIAEEITMKNGEEDGPARSWYPSGFLKAEITMAEGKAKSQTNYADGQRDSVDLAKAGNP